MINPTKRLIKKNFLASVFIFDEKRLIEWIKKFRKI
jgi:hypothetical protein